MISCVDHRGSLTVPRKLLEVSAAVVQGEDEGLLCGLRADVTVRVAENPDDIRVLKQRQLFDLNIQVTNTGHLCCLNDDVMYSFPVDCDWGEDRDEVDLAVAPFS